MKIQSTAIGVALMFTTALTNVVAAEDEGDRWQFITTPFLWASGIEGDMTLAGRTIDVDLGFDDLLDVTDFGFQTYLELRKKQFGFYAAPSYMKLSGDASAGPLKVDWDQDFLTVEGGGFFNLVNTGDDTPFTLDLIAGVSYWNVDTDVEIKGGGPLGVDLNIGRTFEVIDPIIGLRMREYITRKLSVSIRGNVGGFDISEGETSKFSWQALGLLGYDLSRRFTIFGGYRAVGIEAEEGDQSEIDLIFQGLMLGLQVKW